MATAAKLMTVKELTLKNGAKLLFKHFPHAPRVSFSFFIPGGNLLDSTPGESDMIDRLLTQGTESRTQEQIAVEMDNLSLDLDVETKRDYSVVSGTILEEDMEASMVIVSDLFYKSTLADLEREKAKQAGEIQMELDSPKAKASDNLISTVFQGTRYGYVSSVILENLEKLSDVTAMKSHYRRLYQPNRMTICVTGDIAEDKLVRLLEQYFPAESGYESLEIPASATQPLETASIDKDTLVTFARDDSSQAHIYKSWLSPHVTHPDYVPLVVMNTILGSAGLSSRLFVELRDKQGLAYNVRSSLEAYRHRGMFSIYIGTEPSNKDKCLEGFKIECQKLMDTPVDDKELADAKRNMLGRRTVYLETAYQQNSYIGTNFILGRSLAQIERIPDEINAVTAADIQRVAQEYLTKPSVISMVGPSSIL